MLVNSMNALSIFFHVWTPARANTNQILYTFREAATAWGLQSRDLSRTQPLFGTLFGAGHQNLAPRAKEIAWLPPPFGHYKLNVASTFGPTGTFDGIGGVLRDYTGQPIFGYSARAVAVTPGHAMLQSLKKGLQLCCNLDLEHPHPITLFIEGDTELIQTALDEIENLPLSHIIAKHWAETFDVMSQIPRWNLDYVPSEANRVAEQLACLYPPNSATYVMSFPIFIQFVINEEMDDLVHNRATGSI